MYRIHTRQLFSANDFSVPTPTVIRKRSEAEDAVDRLNATAFGRCDPRIYYLVPEDAHAAV